MKRRNRTRLRQGALASATAMAGLAATRTEAGVILNDISDVAISNPGDTAIDGGLGIAGFTPYSTTLDLPGVSDLLLGVTYFGGETKSETPGGSTSNYGFAASPSAYATQTIETKGETKQETTGTEATMYQTARLDAGAVIGNGGAYTTTGALTGWENVGDIGYLGLAIEIDGYLGADLYGWVLIERTAVNEMTIYEWAYEDSGAQLLAGSGGTYNFGAEGTGVPEPAAIMLLAAGGVAAFRLRRHRLGR
ncbi:MAG: PEP-CTERM sorting domain-containing protein [Gammaproteobacteria bacterium]|nr:PEP-CTERM sorting domain-containing protein [Gammaproteobacteria bacterium]MCP5136754.1 PEP-CTERM sorting domain-containing protein [Gammaproteobacteria bacterium]